jgi:hypothetical protein
LTVVEPETAVVAAKLRVVPPVEIHTVALEWGTAAWDEQLKVFTVKGTGLPIG